MSTDEKKIIPFSGFKQDDDGGEAEHNRKKKRDAKTKIKDWLVRHKVFTVVTAVLLPISLEVFGPFMSRNIGNVELTESYMIPSTYAQEEYVANIGSADAGNGYGDTAASAEDGEQIYEKNCVLRSFFSCDKSTMVQATNSTLNVHSLEEYEYSDVTYFSFAKGNDIRIYAVNSGNGASDPAQVTLRAELAEGENYADAVDCAWAAVDADAESGGTQSAEYQNIESETEESQNTEPQTMSQTIAADSVEGGDGQLVYDFTLSEWALDQLEQGNKIMVYGNVPTQDGMMELMLGIIYMQDGKVVMEGGGAGDDNYHYTYYVYVNVPEDSGKEISVNAAFAIQDRAAVDTVIIPGESCRIRYSMTYRVEGKDMETEEFSATIKVPLYRFFGDHSVAFHMNEEDLQHYEYASNSELHDRVKYDPLSVTEEAEQ